VSGLSMPSKFLLASALGASLVLSGLTPAAADTGSEDDLDVIMEIAPEILTKTSSATMTDGELVLEGTDATVVIPSSSSEPILIQGEVEVRVSLPEEGDVPRILEGELGAAVVDHGNGASSVPVVHQDGSLQIATVLSDSSAPSEYAYSISVEGASSISIQEDGSVFYLDSAGDYLAGVVAPWARDANGKDLPTYFKVDGVLLTQYIDHSGPDVKYPVVADPWLGQDLFGAVKYNLYGWYKGYGTVSIAKSLFGQALHVPANNGIFLSAGWSELDTKDTRDWMKLKYSMREQFDCHVAGGYFNFAGSAWDFELARPNTLNGWPFLVITHHCNWNYANGLV
jgi:hypothetical protein